MSVPEHRIAEGARRGDGLRGGILPYFTVSGFVDPVDSAARAGLLLALLLIVVLLVWGWLMKPHPAPLPVPNRDQNPLQYADEVQEFTRRMKDRARGRIDGNGKH